MNTITVGSLFSGAGALDLAVHHVLDAEPAWFVENDRAASKVLVHHWPETPNHGDITAVDWATVEPIDVLIGGFPCQDISTAGKRAGLRPDTRSGLWSHMAYAISQLQPELVIIENVRGLLSAEAHCDLEPCPWCLGDNESSPLRALGAVLGDLATLGYVGRWYGLRASVVGAPHGRFRVFITAWPAADPVGGELQRRGVPGVVDGPSGSGEGERPERERDRHSVGDRRPAITNTDHVGQIRSGSSRGGRSGDPDRREFVADPASQGRGQPNDVSDHSGPAPQPAGETEPGRRNSTATDSSIAERGGPEHLGSAVERTAELGERLSAASWDVGRRGSAATDPNGARRGPGSGMGQPTRQATERNDPPTHSQRSWVTADGTDYGPAIHRWETILSRPAPDPTITGKRGGQQLSPYFTEWMQGWPNGWVTAVPGLSRNDMIRLAGNGVVPHQAAAALNLLLTSEERAA